MTTTTTETTLADGLRQLADFVETHPELGERIGSPRFYLWSYTEADFKETNRLLGSFTKSSDINYLNAEKMFGPVMVQSTIGHAAICEKKVVGTRMVSKQVPADPDYVEPEYVTVQVEELVTEWVCPPEWR